MKARHGAVQLVRSGMRDTNLHDRNKAEILEDGYVRRVVLIGVVAILLLCFKSVYCSLISWIDVIHLPVKTSREQYLSTSNFAALC